MCHHKLDIIINHFTQSALVIAVFSTYKVIKLIKSLIHRHNIWPGRVTQRRQKPMMHHIFKLLFCYIGVSSSSLVPASASVPGVRARTPRIVPTKVCRKFLMIFAPSSRLCIYLCQK